MTDAEIRAEATTPEKKEALKQKLIIGFITSLELQGPPLNDEQIKQIGITIEDMINNALKK